MRTLKKTLALVLVLAMMFSLCVTASADFTDAEEVTNAKAVATLVALGVIDGMPDGTFAPEGTLTRAQAAKIIAYLHGVGEFAANGAETGFADVPASHWASGYIAYCVEAGILDGYGNGKFGPSDTLTGYAWSKMLLCALGYDADFEGYTGSAWRVGVAKDAVALRLWAGVETVNNDPISRDDACQLAYNVLNQDAKRAVYVLGEFYDYADEGEFDVANLGLDVEEAATYDELDRPIDNVTVYNCATTKTSVVYTAAAEPVLTYTAGVKAEKIKKDLGYATKDFDDCDLDIADNAQYGKGVLVEVYNADVRATEEVEYYVNVIETYAYKLTDDGDIIDAKAATDKADEVKAAIVLPGVEVDYETAAYEKGDVILYNIGTNADGETIAVNVAKAESITGKVTATAAAYVKIDGVKYETADRVTPPTLNTTAVYYLDQYGYIKYMGDVQAPRINTKVIAVLAEEYKEAQAGSLIAEDKAPVAKLQVLDLETGVVSVVDRAVVLEKNGNYYFAGIDGKATETEVENGNNGDGKSITYYKYVVLEDGTYALGDTVAPETVEIKQGQATIAEGKTATSKTTLTVVTYKTDRSGAITGATVETVTGIANFPKTALTSAFVTAKDGVVSALTVVKAAVVTADPAEYAIYAGKGEVADRSFEYNFVVAGETVTYVAEAAIEALEALEGGEIVSYTLKAGKLFAAEAVTGTEATVAVVDETFFTDAAGVAHYFAADVEIVDEGAEYAVAEGIAAEDEITYITGTNAVTKATEVVYILIAAVEE